jgi:hypothetical protein
MINRKELDRLTPEDLDEAVHDAADELAASINNGGLEAQINFLDEQFGPECTKRIVTLILKDKE